MKRLALLTLLSSILVSGITLALYFMPREMDISSASVFLLYKLVSSSLVFVLALFPAAVGLPTLPRSVAAVVSASCIGTMLALAVVVVHIWGSLSYLAGDGPVFLSQLKNLIVPGAIALTF